MQSVHYARFTDPSKRRIFAGGTSTLRTLTSGRISPNYALVLLSPLAFELEEHKVLNIYLQFFKKYRRQVLNLAILLLGEGCNITIQDTKGTFAVPSTEFLRSPKGILFAPSEVLLTYKKLQPQA